ncbi:MAG: SGNH/GDSL hydrolase family protein [bacterium]
MWSTSRDEDPTAALDSARRLRGCLGRSERAGPVRWTRPGQTLAIRRGPTRRGLDPTRPDPTRPDPGRGPTRRGPDPECGPTGRRPTGRRLTECRLTGRHGRRGLTRSTDATADAARPTPRSTPPRPDAARPADPPAFLALGDSYTIGSSVEPAERWPAQLVGALRGRRQAIGDPRYIAQNGWTTFALADALDREALAGPFGLVTLLIGVNDQFFHEPAEAYGLRFTALLDRAIALAGAGSLPRPNLSIPDYSVTPFGLSIDPVRIAREVAEFNAVNRRITVDRGVRYVDVTPRLSAGGWRGSRADRGGWAAPLGAHVRGVGGARAARGAGRAGLPMSEAPAGY